MKILVPLDVVPWLSGSLGYSDRLRVMVPRAMRSSQNLMCGVAVRRGMPREEGIQLNFVRRCNLSCSFLCRAGVWLWHINHPCQVAGGSGMFDMLYWVLARSQSLDHSQGLNDKEAKLSMAMDTKHQRGRALQASGTAAATCRTG